MTLYLVFSTRQVSYEQVIIKKIFLVRFCKNQYFGVELHGATACIYLQTFCNLQFMGPKTQPAPLPLVDFSGRVRSWCRLSPAHKAHCTRQTCHRLPAAPL